MGRMCKGPGVAVCGRVLGQQGGSMATAEKTRPRMEMWSGDMGARRQERCKGLVSHAGGKPAETGSCPGAATPGTHAGDKPGSCAKAWSWGARRGGSTWLGRVWTAGQDGGRQ